SANVVAVLQLTGSNIGVCSKYVAGVKNAPRDQDRIATELVALRTVLIQVLQLVDAETARTSQLESGAASRLSALDERLHVCGDEMKRLRTALDGGSGSEAGWQRGIQALTWPLKEAEINKTVDSIRRLKDSLITAMEIYDWLAAPDHEIKHRNARSVHQETTGLWFVEEQRFQEWREAPHSFLWLHGIRESKLSRYCSSDPSTAMAFFYFDFNDKDSLPDVVFRSLIGQLTVQSTTIPHALETLFSRNAGTRRSVPQEELMSTLKSIIGGFKAVYIVFDALDECPERSRFLGAIKDIHDWKIDTLHLLATSRKERDIEDRLSGLISHEVPLYENLLDGDIRVHVSSTLEGDVKFRRYSAGEKEMVMTTLMQGAQGMFRWVVCQLDALRKCKTPAALKKALTHLPKTLNETYDRILAAIDEDDKQNALSLLQWLAFSFNTLSLDQAVEVIATDPDAIDEPLFDQSRRFQDPQDILAICSSLVTITFWEDSSNSDHNDNSILSTEAGEIRLAHFSVREYLISEHLRRSTAMLSCYYFNEKLAHVFIAKTCLAYLLQFDQDNGVNWNTTRFYPLSHYATNNWMKHAGWDPTGNSDDLHELIMTLLEPTSMVYINWMWLYHNSHPWAESGTYPLYIAAKTGLERACQCLVQKGSDVNAPGPNCRIPLEVAASQGHDAIVRLLLDKGAD
ncbi:hypothetical protein JB92DRAFT_2677115, partial [Gautieria morchelliformis]